jgi:hypothetical protein
MGLRKARGLYYVRSLVGTYVANVCDGYEITATAIALLIAVIVPSGSDGRQQTHETRKRGHGSQPPGLGNVYSIASSVRRCDFFISERRKEFVG